MGIFFSQKEKDIVEHAYSKLFTYGIFAEYTSICPNITKRHQSDIVFQVTDGQAGLKDTLASLANAHISKFAELCHIFLNGSVDQELFCVPIIGKTNKWDISAQERPYFLSYFHCNNLIVQAEIQIKLPILPKIREYQQKSIQKYMDCHGIMISTSKFFHIQSQMHQTKTCKLYFPYNL